MLSTPCVQDKAQTQPSGTAQMARVNLLLLGLMSHCTDTRHTTRDTHQHTCVSMSAVQVMVATMTTPGRRM
jgi:hypothetical protein